MSVYLPNLAHLRWLAEQTNKRTDLIGWTLYLIHQDLLPITTHPHWCNQSSITQRHVYETLATGCEQEAMIHLYLLDEQVKNREGAEAG